MVENPLPNASSPIPARRDPTQSFCDFYGMQLKFDTTTPAIDRRRATWTRPVPDKLRDMPQRLQERTTARTTGGGNFPQTGTAQRNAGHGPASTRCHLAWPAQHAAV